MNKEGADFSHDGRWSYSVLLATMQDGEWIAGRLRGGNVRSSVKVQPSCSTKCCRVCGMSGLSVEAR